MVKKLKQGYYSMLKKNNLLFADLIKLFNKDHQTIYRWIRDKETQLNTIDVLNLINKHLEKEGKERITDYNKFFEN